MTTLLHTMSIAHPRFAENEIALRIIALFESFPDLVGFTVEERGETGEAADQAPSVGNVRFGGSIREDKRAEIARGIRSALAEMARELPETLDWLSGRTYNRTLHQLLDTRALRAQGEKS